MKKHILSFLRKQESIKIITGSCIKYGMTVLFFILFFLLPPLTFANHCDGLDPRDPTDTQTCADRVGNPPTQYCDNTNPNQSSRWQNGSAASTAQHTELEICDTGYTCTTANGATECVPKGALPSIVGGPIGSECEYDEHRDDGMYTCRGIWRGQPNNPQCEFDRTLAIDPACHKTAGGGTVDQIFGKVLAPSFVSGIGFGSAGISTFLANILRLLYVAGILIFVFMIVFSAVQWIASGGDKEGISKARSRLTNAVIGIALLGLAGFLITLLGKILGFNFFG